MRKTMRHDALRPVFSVLLVVILTPLTLRAEVTNKQLLACADVGTDVERLTCYDRLSAALRSVQPSSARHESAPATTPPDLFGLAPVQPKPDDASHAELKSIAAHIAAFKDSRNGAVIDLDNGQKWQQMGHEDLMLKDGEKVVISRGAFGSFWIMTEYNRSAHVKRLL